MIFITYPLKINSLLYCLVGENDVLDLLCESLQGDRDHLRDLAKVIHSKTMGNTLFVIQFLAILYRRALVRFDWYDNLTLLNLLSLLIFLI